MFTCRVSVRAVGDIYGVETIFIIDGLDFIPQLRFMIRGTPSQDEDVVAGKFGKCHRESMDSVGMEGQFEFEEFYERIVRSVKIAAELMVRHGFNTLSREREAPTWKAVWLESNDLPS